MNMRTLLLMMIATLSMAAGVAHAQSASAAAPKPPAPAAAPPAAPISAPVADKSAEVIPKHKCARPDLPAKFENDAQQRAFVKQMDGYRDCLMAYRNEMNKLAQAHIAAANGAIDEFNAFVKTVNGQ